MPVDSNVYGPILSFLRQQATEEGELPWPAGLTEDEQVAFMSLPDVEGVGVISLTPAFARLAIREGSLEAGVAATNIAEGYILVDGEWIRR